MPRLSDSMEEGTVLRWLKAEGDQVERGEELVEIETDKANMVYEADESGVLAIIVAEGDTVAIGAPSPIATPWRRPGGRESGAGDRSRGSCHLPRRRGRQRWCPARRRAISGLAVARRAAAKLGVALESFSGTGPNGGSSRPMSSCAASGNADRHRRLGAGGRRAPRPRAGAKGEVEVVELSRLQQTVARRMAQSKATAPHFVL